MKNFVEGELVQVYYHGFWYDAQIVYRGKEGKCGQYAVTYIGEKPFLSESVKFFSQDEIREIREPIKITERAVKLTLEKAKEWYKKGKDLREIALQVFSEEELNPTYYYGKKMIVNGMTGYVIGLDKEYGYPNVWISEKLGTPSLHHFSDYISKEESGNIRLRNGWHIPSYGELQELRDGIYKAMKVLSRGTLDNVMWTSNDHDPMCWWGIDEHGNGIPLRPCFAILRKD